MESDLPIPSSAASTPNKAMFIIVSPYLDNSSSTSSVIPIFSLFISTLAVLLTKLFK